MDNKFTFIDLFAGIGGFHLAMHQLGGQCVFASEIDDDARSTYEYNFKKYSPKLFQDGLFNKDIKSVMPEEIPDFDVLCAGFPCQPFSQAGYKRGFEDNHKSERGNLFFDIVEIIKIKKPKAFFLENVRGIVNHDNGNTFKTIKHILTEELGYSFYSKIIKASDYGLPQLRPRTFMVGFRDGHNLSEFHFPEPLPLRFNMSDVWGGECSREIGFTIRVGGKGSNINDRRNWDSYLVNGEVKRLSYVEARKMQGFPDDFHFPVSKTQAMKQLGNSVAIDAVKCVGGNVIDYMCNNVLTEERESMHTKNNKGEWSELFTFVKVLLEKRLYLSDEQLNKTSKYFDIKRVTTRNLDLEFLLLDGGTIKSTSLETGEESIININDIIDHDSLNVILDKIKEGSGSFKIEEFEVIQTALGFKIVKGGTSYQKADIVLDAQFESTKLLKEGFGIKSYLGSAPTLLNASLNTNFIFEISNLKPSDAQDINNISTNTKIKDRICKIIEKGGDIAFQKAEKDTMNYNLKMIDHILPDIIGYVLLAFYRDRITKLSDIVDHLHTHTNIKSKLKIEDKEMLIDKLMRFLVGTLLGIFAGKKWNGEYESNGTIIVKESGDLVTFHIIELDNLKRYLFNNIRLDTPSSSRHNFGKIIIDKNNMYLKLNLQLRF